MSAQSITNAIGRITVNPSKNIPVSTQIVEAVTDYLKEENLNNNPKRAMAIISTVISHVREKGEALLQQIQEGKYGSEKARTQLQNGIRKRFELRYDNELLSFQTDPNTSFSGVNLSNALLIVINVSKI